MSAVVTERSLDEILDLKEPERTQQLTQWMESSDEPVKLKAQSAPWKIDHNGKVFNISPQGKDVGRRDAVYLLHKWGKNGIYRNKDRKTGFTQILVDQMQARDDDASKYWARRGYPDLKKADNYVYHAVREQNEEDAV